MYFVQIDDPQSHSRKVKLYEASTVKDLIRCIRSRPWHHQWFTIWKSDGYQRKVACYLYANERHNLKWRFPFEHKPSIINLFNNINFGIAVADRLQRKKYRDNQRFVC